MLLGDNKKNVISLGENKITENAFVAELSRAVGVVIGKEISLCYLENSVDSGGVSMLPTRRPNACAHAYDDVGSHA